MRERIDMMYALITQSACLDCGIGTQGCRTLPMDKVRVEPVYWFWIHKVGSAWDPIICAPMHLIIHRKTPTGQAQKKETKIGHLILSLARLLLWDRKK